MHFPIRLIHLKISRELYIKFTTENPEETMVILTFTLDPFRVSVNYTYSYLAFTPNSWSWKITKLNWRKSTIMI